MARGRNYDANQLAAAGKYERALARYRRALVLADSFGLTERACASLMDMGNVYDETGNRQAAAECYTLAENRAGRAGKWRLQATACNEHAIMLYNSNHSDPEILPRLWAACSLYALDGKDSAATDATLGINGVLGLLAMLIHDDAYEFNALSDHLHPDTVGADAPELRDEFARVLARSHCYDSATSSVDSIVQVTRRWDCPQTTASASIVAGHFHARRHEWRSAARDYTVGRDILRKLEELSESRRAQVFLDIVQCAHTTDIRKPGTR